VERLTVSPVGRAGLPAVLRRAACLVDQDAKCLDYLDWLRWPDGFVCPGCGSLAGWR